MAPSIPLVTIKNLSVKYDEAEYCVLNDINLTIHKGELVLLCGPTGSGKSTLAQVLNGLIPYATPAEVTGFIEVCGRDPRETPTPQMSQDVGLVFQDPEGQLCTLFLEDEIAFGPENLNVAREELASRVNSLLDLISLQRYKHDSVFELSGGQKQKVNIASVLSMQPKLLVFDMPTANLDPIGSLEVFQVIRDLVSKEEATCIVIENRLDDLVHLADRIIVMKQDGSIAFDGTPAKVFLQGRSIMDELGVELPQVVELGVRLQDAGLKKADEDLPLTINSTIEWMGTLIDAGKIEVLKNTQRISTKKEPATEKIVEVSNLHFSYGKGPEILKDVSFKMDKGEILAIVGNNGSGKTTLVKQLVGLLKPVSGDIKVCGLDMHNSHIADIAARAAYVFQYPEHQFVAQGQSVFDEIAFNLRAVGENEEYIKERVDLLIERCQLTGKENASPFLLSGGEMRLVSVACMLSTKPDLLILDEPTYGQDRKRITVLMNRLTELRKTGTSIIMISHDMRLVAEYSTKVLLLSNGKIEFYGEPYALFEQPELLANAALKEPPICAMLRTLKSTGHDFPAQITTISDLLAAIKVR